MKTIDKFVAFHMAVTDMAKAKEFYVDKLGFKVTKDYRKDDDHWWVQLDLSEDGPSLNLTTFPEHMKPGTMKFYASTKDVEATYKELKAKGIQPTSEIKDDEWGRWFGFNDPEGNLWKVVQ